MEFILTMLNNKPVLSIKGVDVKNLTLPFEVDKEVVHIEADLTSLLSEISRLVQPPLDAVQEVEYTLNGYQRDGQRVANKELNNKDRLIAASLGLNGEAGEFADLVKKTLYHGYEKDVEKLISELGDVLWYVQEAARVLGLTLDLVARYNTQKLRNRYPKGFVNGGGFRETVS